MKRTTRGTAIVAVFLCLSTLALNAQERTTSGVLLNWANPLSIQDDQLANGRHSLPAHAFLVQEADPSMALAALRVVYASQGVKFSGSDPVRASVTVAGMGAGPISLLASASKDKKSGGCRMRVAYAANDSVPVEGGRDAALALAVQVNRAIIQDQIIAQQKLVDKATARLTDAQDQQAKAQKKAGSAAEDLEKAKKDRSDLADKQAGLQKDQQRMQERYNATKDAKDLEKLTKVQADLVKLQEALARVMRTEADAQREANKRQEVLPGMQRDQQQLQASKEQAVSELEALKRKLEAVR